MSILSGGNYRKKSFSSKTLYYNHETDVFTNGPALLKGRSNHGSATCVDKVNNKTIPVVAGGLIGDMYPTKTTELLLNGEWKKGTYILLLIIQF